MAADETGRVTRDELLAVCALLARLVKDEYPDGLTLPEIVSRWTPLGDDVIEMVGRVERALEA